MQDEGRRSLIWLDSEEMNPGAAARGFEFVRLGAAPPIVEWILRPWLPVYAERRVYSYDDLVPQNRDFIHWMIQEARARRRAERALSDEERYARIPPRRRRHDRL